jgi:ATP-dependent DNA helicase RecG
LQDKIYNDFAYASEYAKKAISELIDGKRVIDLLLFVPINYGYACVLNSNTPKPEGVDLVADVIILSHLPSFKISPKSPYKILAEFEDSTPLTFYFFGGNAGFWKSSFKENTKYTVTCKLQKIGKGYQAVHPKIIKSTEIITNSGILTPRYSSIGNVSPGLIRNLIEKNIELLEDFTEDWYLKTWDGNLGGISINQALHLIHYPKTIEDIEKARKRLAFDEFLAKNLAFLIANFNTQKIPSPVINLNQNFLNNTLKELPFELTQDQLFAFKQIADLQAKSIQNSVLLQGDVGSGKTIVAMLAAINAVLNGFQVAVMSPTSILARQTFDIFEKIASKFGISVMFFSGEDKGKKRQRKTEEIKENRVQIAIGTHALFSDDVVFANLGYVIIDEQHRFGTNQRFALTSKSSNVKTLLMTATPIPRTLSMALFGDIEVVYIKEKPKNRKEIITKLFGKEKILEIIEAIKRKIAQGEQIYWVVPFIEEAEDEGKRNGTSIEERMPMLKQHFKEDQISVVHGKMKEAEISAEMLRFKEGKTKIMLATTVIEVGVDVPLATVIAIESAENFGLSSLHQLRGRVGRGDLQSYCFLIAGLKSENKSRLNIITSSNDGFFIAEKDMEIRGSGAIFSKQQSGFEGFKFFNPSKDFEIAKLAKLEAKRIFNENSHLTSEYGKKIRHLLKFYNYDTLISYYKI